MKKPARGRLLIIVASGWGPNAHIGVEYARAGAHAQVPFYFGGIMPVAFPACATVRRARH